MLSEQNKLARFLWGLACVAVIAAIPGGLLLTGGPQEQRARRMDERRSEDLGNLQRLIASYIQTYHHVPQMLNDLVSAEAPRYRQDPVTRQPYGYRKTADDSFELCATFETDTQTDTREPKYYGYESPYGGAGNSHRKGLNCFALRRITGNERPDDLSHFEWVRNPR